MLHVRSVSHWAPVCIGPYSQAVSTQGVLRLAGQIGLVPHVMRLVRKFARTVSTATPTALQRYRKAVGGWEAELRQTVANVRAVLEAKGSAWTDACVLHMTLFVSEAAWTRSREGACFARVFGSG